MTPKIKAIITFARETWHNDGAEGEAVHALCDELERIEAVSIERLKSGYYDADGRHDGPDPGPAKLWPVLGGEYNPGPMAPLLNVKPDTRSARWREAEARCTASHADPADLVIIAEEQAKWDRAHPECGHPPLEDVEQLLFCQTCHASKMRGTLVLGQNDNAVGLVEDGHFLNLYTLFDPALRGKLVVITIAPYVDGALEEKEKKS